MVSRSSTFSATGTTQLLAPANRTTTTTSASLDTRDGESAALLFNVGAAGDTLSGTVYIELEVQESNDNSTWTAVANTDLNNYVTGSTNAGTAKKIAANADANQAYLVGYKGGMRYIRGVDRRTGTHSTGTPTGIVGISGRRHLAPANANT